MLTINFLYREPRKTGFSIEGIFHLVTADLHDKIGISQFYCAARTSRFRNIRAARKSAGPLNHITGDVNFLAIGLFGRKNILTIHDLGFYENPVHPPLVKFVYRLFWFTLPLKFIDRVTVVSAFPRDKPVYYFHFPSERIDIIPNPVKPVFVPAPRVPSDERPVVLMMGTGKHKNLGNLIEALRDTRFRLDIIGWPDASEVERLQRYRIPYTIYNGLSDECVFERYAACDVLFMASFYEGFGMPIIEAQSVGRPVITSNIGAMKELGEGSALLVDPNDIAAIREALLRLSRDPELYQAHVHAGFENAKKFHHEKIASMYLAVYRKLSGKNTE
jgi:glycosyltransferase involved in cell wall biosynthesis